MKRKYFLYVSKTGDTKLYNDKVATFDQSTDWIEVELNLEIPSEVFEKPKLRYDISLQEQQRKQFVAVTKSSTSLGLAELRSVIPDENPAGPLAEER